MPRTLPHAWPHAWKLRTTSSSQVPANEPIAGADTGAGPIAGTGAGTGDGTSARPTYISTMQAIAAGEAHAQRLLSAWSAHTNDRNLAETLQLVALRSAEQAAAFQRRLYELGADTSAINPALQAELDEQLRFARSQHSDRDKFEMLLSYDQPGSGRDPLSELFQDPDIDIESGALLGRYVATERDSERRLRKHWSKLSTMTGHAGSGGEPVNLRDIFAQLDRLTRTIEELKSMAQGPAPDETRH